MRDLGLGEVAFAVAAGDWHGNARYAQKAIQWVANKVPEATVILQTGDFLGAQPYPHGYVRVVEDAAARADVVVAFVDGNHEDFTYLNAQPIDSDGVRRLTEHVWHLPRGLRWEWSGQRFLALGGAVSVDKYNRTAGFDWWPEEAITYAQADAVIDAGITDIMVCHDTPAGYDIPGLPPESMWPKDLIVAANQHRNLLRAVVDQVKPYLLLHGHYHVRYDANVDGRPTHVIGLDCDGSPWLKNMEVLRLPAFQSEATGV